LNEKRRSVREISDRMISTIDSAVGTPNVEPFTGIVKAEPNMKTNRSSSSAWKNFSVNSD